MYEKNGKQFPGRELPPVSVPSYEGYMEYLSEQADLVIAEGGRPVGYIAHLRAYSPYTLHGMAYFALAFSPARRRSQNLHVAEGDVRDIAARTIAFDVMDIVDSRTGKPSTKWRMNHW